MPAIYIYKPSSEVSGKQKLTEALDLKLQL